MKIRTLVVVLFCLMATPVWSQAPSSAPAQEKPQEKMRYANMPPSAVPYGRFRKPYYNWYLDPSTLEYDGAARSIPEPALNTLKTINIGFLGPLDQAPTPYKVYGGSWNAPPTAPSSLLAEGNPNSLYGIHMLHGTELAIDNANAQGGYKGKPFSLKVYDDAPLWGNASMAIVDMYYKQHVWAMVGGINSASTHIALRVTLKLQVPIIDTATTDPTVTETRIPWLIHNYPDDRQQGYALADYVFNQRKLHRVGLLRENSHYGRMGFEEFFNSARRLGHQPVVAVKYIRGAKDFSEQLRTLKGFGIDGLVLWGNAPDAALILKQMRAMGMNQPVFGSSRIAYPSVIKIAGSAANGLFALSAINPDRNNPEWLAFRRQYLDRYHEEPDAYAAYAYDGTNMLIAAIRKAGLNRALIMDALRDYEMKRYQGVSGTAFFDYTLNNIAPMTFAEVRDGHFVYWPEQRTDWKNGDPLNAMR